MIQVTVMDEHERVLDYAYDMLATEEKASFETHLATCTRCQDELAAMGHVRQVAKAALPMVEPTERLTGALHAQLMHEAGKRQPAGKMLPFMRRVLKHPGYAAAASVLIIGGAVGVQWSRGRLLMPAPAKSEIVAAAPVPPPPPEPPAVTPAADAPTPVAAAEKNKVMSPQPVLKGRAMDGVAVDKKMADDLYSALAKDRSPRYKQEEAQPKGASSLEPSEPAPAPAPAQAPAQAQAQAHAHAKKSSASTETALREEYAQKPRASAGPRDALDDVIAADERRNRGAGPAQHGLASEGQSSNAAGGLGAASQGVAQNDAVTKSPSRPTSRTETEHRAASMPPAAPVAAAPVQQRQVSAKADAEAAYGGGEYGLSSNGAPGDSAAGKTDPLAADRRHAASLARSGRCDEAVALYASIEQRGTLSASELKSYAGCVRTQQVSASRKQQQAPAKAKSMKASPVPQNADVDSQVPAEKR